MLQLPGMSGNERSMQVITSRGCPFSYNFCYRMDKGIRLRSVGDLIEEIRELKEKYTIAYIKFSDELTMVGEKRTHELCEGILDANLGIK